MSADHTSHELCFWKKFNRPRGGVLAGGGRRASGSAPGVAGQADLHQRDEHDDGVEDVHLVRYVAHDAQAQHLQRQLGGEEADEDGVGE